MCRKGFLSCIKYLLWFLLYFQAALHSASQRGPKWVTLPSSLLLLLFSLSFQCCRHRRMAVRMTGAALTLISGLFHNANFFCHVCCAWSPEMGLVLFILIKFTRVGSDFFWLCSSCNFCHRHCLGHSIFCQVCWVAHIKLPVVISENYEMFAWTETSQTSLPKKKMKSKHYKWSFPMLKMYKPPWIPQVVVLAAGSIGSECIAIVLVPSQSVLRNASTAAWMMQILFRKRISVPKGTSWLEEGRNCEKHGWHCWTGFQSPNQDCACVRYQVIDWFEDGLLCVLNPILDFVSSTGFLQRLLKKLPCKLGSKPTFLGRIRTFWLTFEKWQQTFSHFPSCLCRHFFFWSTLHSRLC